MMDLAHLTDHVILAGYGRVGQSIARVLVNEDAAIVAIDREPDKIRMARKAGVHAYVGDAARAEFLNRHGHPPRRHADRHRRRSRPGRVDGAQCAGTPRRG
jgi:voltage-gated potassium channel Kch